MRSNVIYLGGEWEDIINAQTHSYRDKQPL